MKWKKRNQWLTRQSFSNFPRRILQVVCTVIFLACDRYHVNPLSSPCRRFETTTDWHPHQQRQQLRKRCRVVSYKKTKKQLPKLSKCSRNESCFTFFYIRISQHFCSKLHWQSTQYNDTIRWAEGLWQRAGGVLKKNRIAFKNKIMRWPWATWLSSQKSKDHAVFDDDICWRVQTVTIFRRFNCQLYTEDRRMNYMVFYGIPRSDLQAPLVYFEIPWHHMYATWYLQW